MGADLSGQDSDVAGPLPWMLSAGEGSPPLNPGSSPGIAGYRLTEPTSQIQRFTDPAETKIPSGGKDVNKPGIVAWDGSSVLRLRSTPDSSNNDNISGFLPFNTRLMIVKSFTNGWYFVSTEDGLKGYVASAYVKSNLPEPLASLHRVEGGEKGYAINIAKQYYSSVSNNFGQDNRFYVNVLAFVNGITVPDTTEGWKTVGFQANQLIWIPSIAFAKTLIGVVNSGSHTWNMLDAVGLAGIVDKIEDKIRDYARAIELSGKYIGAALAHYSEEAVKNALLGLAQMLIGAAICWPLEPI